MNPEITSNPFVQNAGSEASSPTEPAIPVALRATGPEHIQIFRLEPGVT